MEQPKIDIQETLDELLSREPDKVIVGGKTYKIGWLHNGTVRKFSHLMLKDKDPWRRNTKACACILLNRKHGLLTWFLMWAWYWIYWRWLYYIKNIDQTEVAAVLNCAKKKIQSEPLMMATILATGMMDTLMTIAAHEAGPAAQGSVLPTP
jgi:hypothetical protein